MGEAIGAHAIEQIEALVKRGFKVIPVIEGRTDLVALPSGFAIHDLEPFLDRPKRVKEEPRFILAESFTGYVNRFKQPTSIVQGSLSRGIFTGKLDYHYTPEQSGSNHSDPLWNTHNPMLVLKLHADFKKLLDIHDELQSQDEFLDLLEELTHAVVTPDEMTVREAVTNFQATSEMIFTSKPNRASGGLEFEYKNSIGTKGSVVMPEVIEFGVPVYEASEPMLIKTFLRYRLSGGQLSFKLVIPQIEKIKRDAFDSVAGAINVATDLPVYITE